MQEISNGKKNIDYVGIMKKSWQITWENKNLWWFGLLASLGDGINLSVPFNSGNFQGDVASKQEIQVSIVDFFNQYSAWIIVGLIVMLALVVLFSILRIFGRIGLIKLVDNALKGKKSEFKNGVREGKIFFWQIFFADIVLGVFIAGVVVVLFMPVGYLFYLGALPAAFLSLFLALIIFLALAILASLMRAYIYIYIILGKISVGEAIENAYNVFSENIFSSIMMLLVLLLAGILFGVAIAGVIIALVLFSALIGGIFFLLFGKMGIIGAVILGFLAMIPSFFLIRSVQETFCQTAWILFLKEIAEIKEEEVAEETQQEVIGEKIPGTEAV